MLDSNSIIAAYQQYLGRVPNDAEVNWWANSGYDATRLANHFVSSPEYQNSLGAKTGSQFVYSANPNGTPMLTLNPNFTGRPNTTPMTTPDVVPQTPQQPQQPTFDLSPFQSEINNLRTLVEQQAQRIGGLGGLGGMPQPTPSQPAQFDPTPYFDAFQKQQQSFMDQWGQMAGFNKSRDGVGSGQWGNYGGNTSPVYRPQQGGAQPRNGWGGPWSMSNPFSATT